MISLPGRWVEAGHVQIGDQLLLVNGKEVSVEEVGTVPYAEKVFNLEIAQIHTYAVGKTGVLVHNSNTCGDGSYGDGIINFAQNNAKSTFELPQKWKSPKGVSGKFSDGKHTFRIDSNNLSKGDRFHVHIYDSRGNEIAVIQGAGTNGIWRATHRGKTLLKPSEVPAELITDIRRLLSNAIRNIKK